MDILGILKGFWESSGLAVLTWREGVMILVSFVLLYLAIAKKFEPLLLLPIAFGILLANLPAEVRIPPDRLYNLTFYIKTAPRLSGR